MSSRWDRNDAVKELQRELHWFLSSAAVHTHLPTLVDELWKLPPGFRQRLLAAHLLGHERTRGALRSTSDVLRRLPPRAMRRVEETRGYVAGPVLWQRTTDRRLATADPTMFVSRPTRRSWDTPATALIRSCLLRLQWLLALYPPEGKTGISVEIRETSALLQVLQADKKLRHASQHPPNLAVRNAILERMPGVAALAEVSDAAQAIINGGTPGTLAEALLGNLLAPGHDDQFFELWTGLTILGRLREAGACVTAGPWDASSGAHHFAKVELADRTYILEWQRSYWSTRPFKGPGRYASSLSTANLAASSLRPDFILYDQDGTRAVLIEVKFSAREEYTPDRAGIVDCLAYQHDLESASARPETVVSLVVASASDAAPNVGEICVVDHASLRANDAVVRQLLGSTQD